MQQRFPNCRACPLRGVRKGPGHLRQGEGRQRHPAPLHSQLCSVSCSSSQPRARPQRRSRLRPFSLPQTCLLSASSPAPGAMDPLSAPALWAGHRRGLRGVTLKSLGITGLERQVNTHLLSGTKPIYQLCLDTDFRTIFSAHTHAWSTLQLGHQKAAYVDLITSVPTPLMFPV